MASCLHAAAGENLGTEGCFLGNVGRRRKAMPRDPSDPSPSDPSEDSADSDDTAGVKNLTVSCDKNNCK